MNLRTDLAIELKEYIEKNGFKDFDDLKGAILNG